VIGFAMTLNSNVFVVPQECSLKNELLLEKSSEETSRM
jgi:hypothetical protein